MYDKVLKDKVKAYYESHFENNDTICQIFNVNERTLRHWAQSEKWERGKLLNETKPHDLQQQILEQGTKETHEQLANAIANKLDVSLEVAQNVSEEMLFKAMSLDFLNKELARVMLIGKYAFESFAQKQPDSPKTAMLAKEMVGMIAQVKQSLFGKEAEIHNVVNVTSNIIDLSKFTDEQLQQIAAQKKQNS
ncbi:MAG: hypothetical protein K2N12_06245 [Helicobacter sp.]|nr:hypothetical protein [Helicobacter sp.]